MHPYRDPIREMRPDRPDQRDRAGGLDLEQAAAARRRERDVILAAAGQDEETAAEESGKRPVP
jgi:hypothetical protein